MKNEFVIILGTLFRKSQILKVGIHPEKHYYRINLDMVNDIGNYFWEFESLEAAQEARDYIFKILTNDSE